MIKSTIKIPVIKTEYIDVEITQDDFEELQVCSISKKADIVEKYLNVKLGTVSFLALEGAFENGYAAIFFNSDDVAARCFTI